MTPAQVETAARRRYNSENDTFFSQDEVFKLIYEAELELATYANVIEATDTSITTVSGTRAYAYPSGFISMKRIEYNGSKLQPTTFREDDVLTLLNTASTTTGTPIYYQEFKKYIYLRPTPDAAQTLTIYGYKEPTLLTTASTTLDVPTEFHADLIDYVLMMFCAKDKDYDGFDRYAIRWQDAKKRARSWGQKRKIGDSFGSVKDMENLTTTIIGIT